MNTYVLYEVKYIKGILMYDWICEQPADNIIEAEYIFETNGSMESGAQYVITIKRL
jgi:hypothetical protein